MPDAPPLMSVPPPSATVGRHDLTRLWCRQHPGEYRRLDAVYANPSMAAHVNRTWDGFKAVSRSVGDGSGYYVWVRYVGPEEDS